MRQKQGSDLWLGNLSPFLCFENAQKLLNFDSRLIGKKMIEGADISFFDDSFTIFENITSHSLFKNSI